MPTAPSKGTESSNLSLVSLIPDRNAAKSIKTSYPNERDNDTEGGELEISFEELGPAFNQPVYKQAPADTGAGPIAGGQVDSDKSAPKQDKGGASNNKAPTEKDAASPGVDKPKVDSPGPPRPGGRPGGRPGETEARQGPTGPQKPDMQKEIPGKKGHDASEGQIEKINYADARKKLGLKENASQDEISTAIKKQIELLGNDEWPVRVKAHALLRSLGPAAIREIAKAHGQTDDPETRRRTHSLLRSGIGGIPEATLKIQENLEKAKANRVGASGTGELEQILKEPTYHATPKDFEGTRLVKNELEQAAKDLGPGKRDKLNGLLRQTEDILSLEKIHNKMHLPRINLADKIAETKPEEALRQLNLAMRDNFQRSNDHFTFFEAATKALKTLGFDNPKSQAWLKTAKEKGVDMKFLEERGGPKAK